MAVLSLWRATAFAIESELPPDQVTTRIGGAIHAGDIRRAAFTSGQLMPEPGEPDVRGHCTADGVHLTLSRAPAGQSYRSGWVRLSGHVVPAAPGSTLTGRFRFSLVSRVSVPVLFCYCVVHIVLSVAYGIGLFIVPLALLAAGLGMSARIVHRGWREQAVLLHWVRWSLSPDGPGAP
jgi:hypothetical protein